VDDTHVTRYGLLFQKAIALADVRSYRMEMPFKTNAISAALSEMPQFLAGGYRYSLELEGPTTLSISWRYHHLDKIIARVLRHIHGRITEAARTELAKTGIARFGPVAFSKQGIQWKNKPPIGAAGIEAVEVFDAMPAQFRLMRTGKILPMGRVRLVKIPNLLSALVIARELGYRVRGLDLLKPVTTELGDWVP
jgi:hypothetical protein